MIPDIFLIIFKYLPLEFELVKCIRRQNILREPTPQPIDAEDEDSATSLLKQRTRFAATLIRSGIEPHIKDPAIKNFASSLNLYPADTETVESNLQIFILFFHLLQN